MLVYLKMSKYIFNKARFQKKIKLSYGYALDPNLGYFAPGGPTKTYGFWMKPSPGDVYNQDG
jgi:hypothetical protein